MKLSLAKTGLTLSIVALASASLFSGTANAATQEDTRLSTLGSSGATTPDFRVHKFNSCDDAKDVITDFIESYYKKHPYTPYFGGGGGRGGVMIMDKAAPLGESAVSATPTNGAKATSDSTPASDYSQTNVQIAWVDESELVKTDGTNIYYYNDKERAIYIVSGANTGKTELVRKIMVPETYQSPELYVADGKLTVVATKYSESNSTWYWYNRNAKTAVIVYDLSDLDKLSIERYYQIDGTLQNSRRIGDYVYVISNTSFSFPYPLYALKANATEGDANIDQKKLADEITVDKIMPRILEIVKTASAKDANYRDNYNSKAGKAAECSDMEYVLPDEKTMDSYDFSPSITNVTAINLKNPKEKAKTRVLFGDVGEVMLSQNALYLTSRLYSASNWACPSYARCFVPNFYFSEQNTLVHRFSVNKAAVSYDSTAVVPGSLMNRYAMDEADGKFRIVTQESGKYDAKTGTQSGSTRVSILDAKSLSPLGSLDKIAVGENFQSSRFIGNRLYLVTFQRIDPLFVIDVAGTTPKILGELKMPGYSTYLHPYADGKLIGLGYDTKTNEWGGTQNAGIKIDLYDVSDVANPKQLATKTFGSVGSYSDAQNDPRLFIWNASRHILSLPVTIMESANDATNLYRSKDAFQGALALSIDEKTGITEVGRFSHIDRSGVSAARAKDCSDYSKRATATGPVKCEKLLGGGEYCPATVSSYVPYYCYESSSDNEYFASQIWSYTAEFVKRTLYLDNRFYAISDKEVTGYDMNKSFEKTSETKFSEGNK